MEEFCLTKQIISKTQWIILWFKLFLSLEENVIRCILAALSYRAQRPSPSLIAGISH